MEIIKIVQNGIELDVIGSVDASSITQDADNRFVTDAEKTAWNNKQDSLTAGANVTIIGTTISAIDSIYDDTALKTRITAVENREDKDTTYDAATTTTNGLMSSTDKTKLDGVEAGAQKNTITSVQGRTGAVTINKSDVGLGSVNNVAITQSDIDRLRGMSLDLFMTEAQYEALSTEAKNLPLTIYNFIEEA